MKITRKGFTLVELLIVVAILGTLAASMMISFGSSTAKAKAASIAANIDSCITAAKLYLADNINNVSATSTAADFLGNTTGTVYVPNWDKMKGSGSNTIKYAAESGAGPDAWNMTVTIDTADVADIVTALKNIKGYEDLAAIATGNTTYTITVLLLKGTATGAGS